MASMENEPLAFDGDSLPHPSGWDISIATLMGGRPRQEDRFCSRPVIHIGGGSGQVGGGDFNGGESSSPTSSLIASFFGVWDGTVCPHASDFVHTRCADHHLASPGFSEYASLVAASANGKAPESGRPAAAAGDEATVAEEVSKVDGGADASADAGAGADGREGAGDVVGRQSPPPIAELARCLADACRQGYAATDAELLESCATLRNNFTSTTSVSVLIASGILTVAHLGDSRAILLVSHEGELRGQVLTIDHKPDDPEERARIEASGGSIQYLHHHNMKPFIRGGDFESRKAGGERMVQLQYSRAFGGKDLKPFGLSAEPSIGQHMLGPDHVGLVLASDGVCDIATGDDIAAVVGDAWEKGQDASDALTSWALQERARCNVGNDNITAVVVGWGGAAAMRSQVAELSQQEEDLPPKKRRPL